ncbi:MAG: Holliday junction resolvase RuvX [Phycisphaerales bacterium]|jgi:putative Holliday junction resolvase|nr:Holliday junction resolvase RuvX [Phycisphaerales bacterium]
MRTLAIDLGAKRIGLALSDEGGRWATPLEVISVNDPQHAIPQLLQLIQNQDVQRLVVGLPLNMDDTIGPAAKQAAAWGKRLSAQSGKPVVFVDERLSSFEAEQQLNDRKRHGEKLTRRRRKEQQDALAAASFLQQFLDGKIPPVEMS